MLKLLNDYVESYCFFLKKMKRKMFCVKSKFQLFFTAYNYVILHEHEKLIKTNILY